MDRGTWLHFYGYFYSWKKGLLQSNLYSRAQKYNWSEHWSPVELLKLRHVAKSISDNFKETKRNIGKRNDFWVISCQYWNAFFSHCAIIAGSINVICIIALVIADVPKSNNCNFFSLLYQASCHFLLGLPPRLSFFFWVRMFLCAFQNGILCGFFTLRLLFPLHFNPSLVTFILISIRDFSNVFVVAHLKV